MIRVLLVDDDALVRSGLRMMLAGASNLEVVAEAADGREVLGAVDLHRPDVVLMDIRMPLLDGIAATRLLTAQPHPPAVLVLTTFDADELVLRALQAGASGFLLKHTPPAEIVRAIELVHAGEGMLSPAVTRRLIALVAGDCDAGARTDDARGRMATLSPREHDVALAVGQGQANAEIAAALLLSVATVKAHVSRLLDKLDVDNRVQIALLVRNASGHSGRRRALAPPAAMSFGRAAGLWTMSELTSTTTTISNIGVAMFVVSDQDEALAFYTGTLGFELRADVPFGERGEARWLEVAPAGSSARLALNPPMGGATPGGGSIGVESTDVAAEHARLSAVDGLDVDAELMRVPGAPLMFMLRDPDGNHLAVVEAPAA